MTTLTDLQKNVLRVLLQHRYYSTWSYEPTALVTQAELATTLNARQAEISTALHRLTAAGYIRPLWETRKGQPKLYLITWPGHRTRPDLRTRYRLMQKTVPGRHQVDRAQNWKTAAPATAAPPDLKTEEPPLTEEQAEAEIAAMLAEQPDLEGYEGSTQAGKPA